MKSENFNLKEYELSNIFKVLSNHNNEIDLEQFRKVSFDYHDECRKMHKEDFNHYCQLKYNEALAIFNTGVRNKHFQIVETDFKQVYNSNMHVKKIVQNCWRAIKSNQPLDEESITSMGSVVSSMGQSEGINNWVKSKVASKSNSRNKNYPKPKTSRGDFASHPNDLAIAGTKVSTVTKEKSGCNTSRRFDYDKKVKETLSENDKVEEALRHKEAELKRLEEEVQSISKLVKQTDLALVNEPVLEVVDEADEQTLEFSMLEDKSINICHKSREFELSSSSEEEDEFNQCNQRASCKSTAHKDSRTKSNSKQFSFEQEKRNKESYDMPANLVPFVKGEGYEGGNAKMDTQQVNLMIKEFYSKQMNEVELLKNERDQSSAKKKKANKIPKKAKENKLVKNLKYNQAIAQAYGPDFQAILEGKLHQETNYENVFKGNCLQRTNKMHYENPNGNQKLLPDQYKKDNLDSLRYSDKYDNEEIIVETSTEGKAWFETKSSLNYDIVVSNEHSLKEVQSTNQCMMPINIKTHEEVNYIPVKNKKQKMIFIADNQQTIETLPVQKDTQRQNVKELKNQINNKLDDNLSINISSNLNNLTSNSTNESSFGKKHVVEIKKNKKYAFEYDNNSDQSKQSVSKTSNSNSSNKNLNTEFEKLDMSNLQSDSGLNLNVKCISNDEGNSLTPVTRGKVSKSIYYSDLRMECDNLTDRKERDNRQSQIDHVQKNLDLEAKDLNDYEQYQILNENSNEAIENLRNIEENKYSPKIDTKYSPKLQKKDSDENQFSFNHKMQYKEFGQPIINRGLNYVEQAKDSIIKESDERSNSNTEYNISEPNISSISYEQISKDKIDIKDINKSSNSSFTKEILSNDYSKKQNEIVKDIQDAKKEFKRSMSPLLKDKRKQQKVKPKDADSTQLKNTIKVNQNVDQLVELNSQFQTNSDRKSISNSVDLTEKSTNDNIIKSKNNSITRVNQENDENVKSNESNKNKEFNNSQQIPMPVIKSQASLNQDNNQYNNIPNFNSNNIQLLNSPDYYIPSININPSTQFYSPNDENKSITIQNNFNLKINSVEHHPNSYGYYDVNSNQTRANPESANRKVDYEYQSQLLKNNKENQELNTTNDSKNYARTAWEYNTQKLYRDTSETVSGVSLISDTETIEMENLKKMVDTLTKENQELKKKNNKKTKYCLCN